MGDIFGVIKEDPLKLAKFLLLLLDYKSLYDPRILTFNVFCCLKVELGFMCACVITHDVKSSFDILSVLL